MKRIEIAKSKGLPDIADLDDKADFLSEEISSVGAQLQQAQQTVRSLEDKLEGLHKAKDQLLPNWMEGAIAANPLYAASFYLDDNELSVDRYEHRIERLHTVHARGVLLCRLAELAEERQLPVLLLRDYPNEQLRSREHSQAAIERRPAAILGAVFTTVGGISTSAAVELGYNISTDFSTGTETRTMNAVLLNYSEGVRIETRTGGFDEYRWIESFEGEEVQRAGALALLGRGGLPIGSKLFVTDIEVDGMLINSVMGDIHVGAKAIERVVDVLPAQIGDREYDPRVVLAIQEKAQELLANAE